MHLDAHSESVLGLPTLALTCARRIIFTAWRGGGGGDCPRSTMRSIWGGGGLHHPNPPDPFGGGRTLVRSTLIRFEFCHDDLDVVWTIAIIFWKNFNFCTFQDLLPFVSVLVVTFALHVLCCILVPQESALCSIHQASMVLNNFFLRAEIASLLLLKTSVVHCDRRLCING